MESQIIENLKKEKALLRKWVSHKNIKNLF